MHLQLREWSTAALMAGPPRKFEGLREVHAEVWDDVPDSAAASVFLEAVRLRCQKGGRVHSGSECMSCRRFVNYRPAVDRRRLTIRCLWNDSDPVSGIMTEASALVAVEPETPIREANDRALHKRVRHLLVADHDGVVGVVCRCDLMPPALPGETVADRMTHHVWVASPSTTLAEATSMMAGLRVGLLPIARAGVVLGVLTRGDLRRAGVEEQWLGATPCAACGSPHGVRPHTHLEAVEFCLDCLEQSLTPTDYDELGAGD